MGLKMSNLKLETMLTLKAPITTAADDIASDFTLLLSSVCRTLDFCD